LAHTFILGGRFGEIGKFAGVREGCCKRCHQAFKRDEVFRDGGRDHFFNVMISRDDGGIGDAHSSVRISGCIAEAVAPQALPDHERVAINHVIYGSVV
jgi:hypothetical protein